jgi:signal transduction histidine kinase
MTAIELISKETMYLEQQCFHGNGMTVNTPHTATSCTSTSTVVNQAFTGPSFSVEDAVNAISIMKTCIEEAHTTNNFMLMTINRCIDYAKASKGMKLSPKNETIDLMETLKMPLKCMLHVQSKVSIILNPISERICSHIITDKQWLQENILCLLSNAVKYSSRGNVSITVSLIAAKPMMDAATSPAFIPPSSTRSKEKGVATLSSMTVSTRDVSIAPTASSATPTHRYSTSSAVIHSTSGTNSVSSTVRLQPVRRSSSTVVREALRSSYLSIGSFVSQHAHIHPLQTLLDTFVGQDDYYANNSVSFCYNDPDLRSSGKHPHENTGQELAPYTQYILFEIEDTGTLLFLFANFDICSFYCLYIIRNWIIGRSNASSL